MQKIFYKALSPFVRSKIMLLILNIVIQRFLIAVCILFYYCVTPLYSQIHLVEWNFPNNPDDVIADNGTAENLSQSISASDNRQIVYFSGLSTYAASAYGWDNGVDSKYWQIRVNTSGFTTLFLSSRQRSSGTGPAEFKLLYSLDSGVSWNDIPTGLVTIADDWNTGILNIRLPDDCNNQPNLIIRWQMSSNLSVNGGTVSGGTSRIDDILITGCNIFLDSFEPRNGPPGTMVTIRGAGFTDVNFVSFNGIETSFEIIDSNTILSIVPPGISSGHIMVKNSSCSSISTAEYQFFNSCPDNHSNLIISELCDPRLDYSTTRYIEIYNPTNHIIDLQGWSVKAISDNRECFTWILSGNINPGQALTCGYNNPAHGGPFTFTDPNWNTAYGCCISWHGERNNGAVLYNGNTVIDYVYYGPSTADWFMDKNLVRNPDVCQPSVFTILTEWKINPVTYAGTAPSTPGFHIAKCTSSVPIITQQPKDISVCENEPVILSVVADGKLPLVFQWKYYNQQNGSWENVNDNEITISNTPNSTILSLSHTTPFYNHWQFYCEVRNSGEDCFQVTNTVSILIEDRGPPSFSDPIPLQVCVEKIRSAEYNSEREEMNPEPPDYYLHVPGNTELDLDPLTFRDNCTMNCDFQVRWRITFNNGEQFPALPQLLYLTIRHQTR
jgi:hypothetical protein